MKTRDLHHLDALCRYNRALDAMMFAVACHARALWIRGWGG